MPLRVVYTFDCDECGHSYGGLIESQGSTPEPPPGWRCTWGAYLCPECVKRWFRCYACDEPIMEPGAMCCAAHNPGR